MRWTLIPGDVFWCPSRTTVRGRHAARCGSIFCSQNAGAPTPTCSKYQTCSTILIPLTSLEELSDGVGAGVGEAFPGVVVAACGAGVRMPEGVLEVVQGDAEV